ncbi:hypothetical protein ACVGOW_08985 [Pseudonocardia saturnea]
MIDETRPSDAKAYAVRAFEAVRTMFGFSTLDFVACTGAKTRDLETQITEAEIRSGRTSWDVVTLGFGGNDLGDGDGGFGEIIIGCLDAREWGPRPRDLPDGCDISLGEAKQRIDVLAREKLPDLYRRVAELVRPGGDIIVVGYPQIFESVDRWDSWRRNVLRNCEGIRVQDIPLLRNVSDYLNASIFDAVVNADKESGIQGVRFHYIDTTATLYEPNGSDNRHGVCSQDPWINGLTVGLRSGDVRYIRSFHPDATGHQATGEAVANLFGSKVVFDDAPEGIYPVGALIAASGSTVTLESIEVGLNSIRANVVYKNVTGSFGTTTCRGFGDPRMTYVQIAGETIYATDTFCANNPTFDIGLDPGESHTSWAVYPRRPATLSQPFSLTWYPNLFGKTIEGIVLAP